MKFLEYTRLNRINDFLSHLNLGERTIKGCLEAYSCKHTGLDKRLSLSLEHEILDHLGKSADTDSSSPADNLICRSSRKTLIYLVLTLYHMYPDYDFSEKLLKSGLWVMSLSASWATWQPTYNPRITGFGSVVKSAVKAHQFFIDETWDSFEQLFDSYMREASKEWIEANGGSSLIDDLYKALDEVVKLSECEIYGYNPDCNADPFLQRGAIWSFNFFFYNRKMKCVVSLRFCCLSNLVADEYLTNEFAFEEDEEIFDNMDI